MRTNTLIAASILTASLAFLAGACKTVPPVDTHAAQVERGRFLVTIGGCNDCHTPMKFDPEIGMPVPDLSRALSGHPEGAPDPASALGGHDMAAIGPTFTSFRAPFGVVYSANLTPDAATGLGAWTEDMFIRALRTGRHMGGAGRPIVPPMPWPTLARQSDNDLAAIFAYLRSVPAIRNDVPAPKVPDAALAAIAAGYEKMAAKMRAQTEQTNVELARR
ncbi:MAG TPA: diheme cytochrome c-553 [Polyangia bacterium]|nr:diheme cytochrome c-553 [Polyangia bacterium]